MRLGVKKSALLDRPPFWREKIQTFKRKPMSQAQHESEKNENVFFCYLAQRNMFSSIAYKFYNFNPARIYIRHVPMRYRTKVWFPLSLP